MKRGIVEVNFPPGQDHFSVALPKDARVVGFILILVDKTSSIALPGQPAGMRMVLEVPTVVLEVDPDVTEMEPRHFLMMPSGMACEGEGLEWKGMALAQKPGVGLLHLYEEKKDAKQEEPQQLPTP